MSKRKGGKRCTKCGKPGHYAKTCKEPVSATARIEAKMEAATKQAEAKHAAPAQVVEEPAPAKGTPFADLPKVSLPSEHAPEGEPEKPADEQTPTEPGHKVPDEKPEVLDAKPDGPRIEFDAEELAEMISEGFVEAIKQTHALCTMAGKFSLGGPFVEKVGKMGAKLVALEYCKQFGIDSATGGGIVCGSIIAVNGWQTVQSVRELKQREKDAKKNAQHASATQATRPAVHVPHAANGAPRPGRVDADDEPNGGQSLAGPLFR
jgi:hypothetical protein